MAFYDPPGEAVTQIVDWVEATKPVTVSNSAISDECTDKQRKVCKGGMLILKITLERVDSVIISLIILLSPHEIHMAEKKRLEQLTLDSMSHQLPVYRRQTRIPTGSYYHSNTRLLCSPVDSRCQLEHQGFRMKEYRGSNTRYRWIGNNLVLATT